jgi:translocation and assembly module TamB
LVPFILIRATTTNADVTSIVEIEGPAIDPDVRFTSTPELPQEEVLAQLLFGQKIQNLSALQGIQLASAIATLAGRGNGGIIARVRGALALDNLDIQSDATGATTLRAGKYLSDKVYTEVTIGPTGQNEINLNLDVSKTVKLHTGLAADGNASIGVVIEKNY